MSTRRPGPASRDRLGRAGERLAAHHLRDDGLTILARNWRHHDAAVRGELDLVALEPGTKTVVVVEVKTRRGDAFGGPLAAVTADKQQRIRALALAFLRAHPVAWDIIRFDVIGIRLDRGASPRLEHVEGAF